MNTPARNSDLRHIDTCSLLTEEERIAAINQSKALKSIRALGNNWLLHPEYSGNYQPELHAWRVA